MTAFNLAGELVRLCAVDLDKDVDMMLEWSRNTEYQHLLDSDPSVLWTTKQSRTWLEEHIDEIYMFAIRTLADDRLIGFVDMDGFDWVAGSAWVGIGIGEPEYWGKGYGTDAMRIILRYAFVELNLRRVALNVFEYNPRAIRSYEKAGFVHEGRQRGAMQRNGQRWDIIYMGILRAEWEARYKDTFFGRRL